MRIRTRKSRAAVVFALLWFGAVGCSARSRKADPVAGGEEKAPAANQNASTPEPKPASETTKKAQAEVLGHLPFSDTKDFENAKRGFIAPLPDGGVIKDANGKAIWDLTKFKSYVKEGESAPETVNPSLWRMAQLLAYTGLFEVVPGVYQIRGGDLSNMTIVEGQKGLTIYDPLVSEEAARSALNLYYAHRPKRPVIAVIYSHSHVDHFGGVRGVVDEKDVRAGKVKILAPEHFTAEAVSENVFAGTAMSRRASYMYGNLIPAGPQGQTTAGLGISTSTGAVTLIAPTELITRTGETKTIDGLTYEFVMAPGSEAPAEMMWFVREKKLLNTSEDSTHTMHNLYTLRGAKTRDASKWPAYLNEVLKRFGDKAEVEIAMHHWPTWGNAEVVEHVKAQRDIYKFIHDQTLHFANKGYTRNELPDLVQLPEALEKDWAVRGYYGSKSHNVRAVYNFYLGFFDGNPAHLDPLPPEAVAKKYVEAMGGRDGVLAAGKRALASGDYRWGAELMNHLVFAMPDDQEAKNVQADILEQLGYQAENGPWRNFYLTGALELRQGVRKLSTVVTASPDLVSNMSLGLLFDYMGIQLDAACAAGMKTTINIDLPDTRERYVLFLEHSVLNAWPDAKRDDADLTLSLNRSTLNELLTKTLKPADALKSGKVKVTGSLQKLEDLVGCLDDLNESLWFNIVTP